jgi:hypothetical protein
MYLRWPCFRQIFFLNVLPPFWNSLHSNLKVCSKIL